MPPNPKKSSEFTAKQSLAAAAKGGVRSAADIATETSARVTAVRERGKVKRVAVVVLQDGYDGLVLHHEGARMKWPLAEGEALPPWVQLESEYDAEQERLAELEDES